MVVWDAALNFMNKCEQNLTCTAWRGKRTEKQPSAMEKYCEGPLLARSRLTAFVSARRKAVVQDQFINQEMAGRFGTE